MTPGETHHIHYHIVDELSKHYLVTGNTLTAEEQFHIRSITIKSKKAIVIDITYQGFRVSCDVSCDVYMMANNDCGAYIGYSNSDYLTREGCVSRLIEFFHHAIKGINEAPEQSPKQAKSNE